MNIRICGILLCGLILLLAGSAWAAISVKVDTFWVVTDGYLTQWEPSVLLADRWKMIWNHTACETDSFLKEDTEGNKYSFTTVLTCPDDYDTYMPFMDSVHMHWCGLGPDGAAGQNLVKLGASDDEGSWKSDSVTYAIGTSQIEIEHPVLNDDGTDWNTYNFYESQWMMEATEIEDEPPFGIYTKAYTSFIITYQTYPETLSDGSHSLALYQADTSIVSEWDKNGCTDINECLKTIDCDDIRTNVADELYLFGCEEITLGEGEQIDSVVSLICGYHQVGGDSSAGIFYGVVSGSDTTIYGLDTLNVPGIEKNGWQQTKVWPTCPATDAAWTAADINDSGKGFGIKSLHTNYIALATYRLMVYLSEVEAGGNPSAKKKKTLGGLFDEKNTRFVYSDSPDWIW